MKKMMMTITMQKNNALEGNQSRAPGYIACATNDNKLQRGDISRCRLDIVMRTFVLLLRTVRNGNGSQQNERSVVEKSHSIFIRLKKIEP